MTTIALLGDSFVTPDLMAAALTARIPHGTHAAHDLRPYVLPWPQTPYGPVAEVHEASGTEDEVITALGDAEICVTQMAPLTRRVLTAAPRLRLVCVARGGPVNVNREAADKLGIAVRSAPGRNATATAEHTVALMLAAARQLPQRQRELEQGAWRSDYYRLDRCGPELGSSTVGIVGYGAVGSLVARTVRAMGARLVVHDPFADPGTLDPADVVADGLDDLLRRTDVLTLHPRLTPENTGMIGAREIALLPPGAILVNAARGPLVDYDAVCDALDSGHLFAAGFDVFPHEPLPPGHRLLHTPHVVMTPHLAGATRRTAELAAQLCAQAVAQFLSADTGLPATG